MTTPINHSKTITQAQVIGEQGLAIVKERVHDMGFLFTPYGPVEAGIDGLIELRDPETGQVHGRLVAVQIKTRDSRPYTTESDDHFEYLCRYEDMEYWQQSNLPIIVILVRLSDRSVYWKLITKSEPVSEPNARRLYINKTTDKFDKNAADAIMHTAVGQAEPGVWLPPSRQPDQLFFNSIKVSFPEIIQTGTSKFRHGPDTLKALLDMSDYPPYEWVVRDGQLITFLDIDGSLLQRVVTPGSIEKLPAAEFALHNDEDMQHIFVELLNRTLRAQLDSKLQWSNRLRLYYFPPARPDIDRAYRYMSFRNETSRNVVKAKRRPDGSLAYVRHSAFHPQFWRSFNEWYLAITPNYVFTWDGDRPDRYAGERLSRLKRRERNSTLRGQFLMWRSLLIETGEASHQINMWPTQSETALLHFEALDMVNLPLSVPDELWSTRDANPPQSNDEELPL